MSGEKWIQFFSICSSPPSQLSRLAIPRWKNEHFFLFLSLSLLISFFLFFTFLSLSQQLNKSPGGKMIISFFRFLCLFLYLSFFSLLFLLLLSTLKKPQMEKTYSNFFLFDFCHFSYLLTTDENYVPYRIAYVSTLL